MKKNKITQVGTPQGVLTYVENALDKNPKALTREIMDQLLDAQRTKLLLEQYRTEGKEEAKKALPAVLFNGFYIKEMADAWVQQDASHSHRQEACFTPSPFYGIDIDLKGCSETMYAHACNEIKQRLGDPQLFLAMAYTTPSGGLRLVVTRTGNLSIDDEVKKWKDILNLPIDTSCKNLSRLYFLTSRQDLLYYNPEMLFPNGKGKGENGELKTENEGGNRENSKRKTAKESDAEARATKAKPKKKVAKAELTEESSTQNVVTEAAVIVTQTADTSYQLSELQDIAHELSRIIAGGAPQEGLRNTHVYELARKLRHITGDDVPLLQQVIPLHGLSKQEHRRTIENALKYSQKMPYAPLDLQCAIDRIMGKGNALPSNDGMQAPQLPLNLPSVIKHIISASPEKTRPAVAMASFSALRILLSEASFLHIDNRYYEPCFMNLCIASQASGKSAIRLPLKEILYDIDREDEINREAERKWREQCAILPANAERPPQPNLPIRDVQADMTNPAMVRLANRADPYSLYSYGEEWEKLLRLKGASEIIRSGYDGEIYGQERVGAQSVSEVAKLRWSFNFSTTPNTARNALKADTNNGTLTRLCICTILTDENDWGEDTPVYGNYGEKFRKKLQKYTKHLLRAKGQIKCQEILEWALHEKVRQTDILKKMDAKYMLSYMFRSLQMGLWRAYLLWLMNGNKWDQTIADFCSWSIDYDMWCKFYYFGQLIEQNSDHIEQSTHRPMMLLSLLPDSFTREEAINMRRLEGRSITSQAVRNMLSQWVYRKFIVLDKETNTYHKTAEGKK